MRAIVPWLRAVALNVFWWAATFAVLFLLDDMMFGPIYWALSAWSRPFSTVMAFLGSLALQQWLVRAGTKEEPGRLARWALKRLSLERKNKEIAKREGQLRGKALGYLGAALVSLLIGGVIPILILQKYTATNRKRLLRFAWVTTIIYAAEFAALHGGYGFVGLFVYIYHALGG